MDQYPYCMTESDTYIPEATGCRYSQPYTTYSSPTTPMLIPNILTNNRLEPIYTDTHGNYKYQTYNIASEDRRLGEESEDLELIDIESKLNYSMSGKICGCVLGILLIGGILLLVMWTVHD